jgi:hypothetical protein
VPAWIDALIEQAGLGQKIGAGVYTKIEGDIHVLDPQTMCYRGSTDIVATSNGNRPTRLGRILSTTLADNGGPTKTHAIRAVSPAVDAVTDGTTRYCFPARRLRNRN